ncbi:MAG: ABC transporter substrate-binding protein [Gammaproteobacteria bacterium]|nr:ABC transporter substrate-binding protein [Gammaproteobacteria bacterium]MDP2348251.1 ABC transporter substrate-binding protein [Gammaproteobacteria bacterium]
MMKIHGWKLLLLVAVTLLVACGGSDQDDGEARDNTQEVLDFYAANPELFTFATPADIPADLVWEDGMDLPEIGSPEAKKGGTFFQPIEDFPPTLRFVGPDSNFSSRSWISGFYKMTWVLPHPDGGGYIPGIAQSWAISPDTKTVYIKINPNARWTDDEPITADDQMFALFFYLSEYIQAPFYNNHYGNEYTNITKYDDHTFSMTVTNAKPDMAEFVLFLNPVPQHFYKELGTDFPERYQWRYEPHAGPYFIDDRNIDMGVRIVLERKRDWWAKDNKYWRYLFNPDRINLTVIRDASNRYEAFRAGNVDIMTIATAEMWYDNLPETDRDVANGYIHKTTFYNDGPRSNWGLWMNSSRPLLDNVEIRQGIQYAANWDLVISNYFRGDMDRLNGQNQGYPDFTHPTLTARPFDIPKALEHFANAGFVNRGPDGILVNEQGQRLAFTLTSNYDRFSDVFTILKQEAIKAGLDLRIEILDGAAGFRKLQEKQHDIYFVSFSPVLSMYPDYWQYFHSDNAYDDAFLDDGSVNPDRKLKPQTNNVQVVADFELDQWIEEYDRSEDKERMIELSHMIQQRHYEYASFSPGFVETSYRTAYWRWVRWPEGFNYRYTTYPYELFVHWIDTDMKTETLQARAAGRAFEPHIKVYDQFRKP